MSPEERAALLDRAGAAVAAHGEELAALASAEAGVPTSQAATTAAIRPAASCRYYAGWTDKAEGEIMPIFPNAGFDYTRLEPYGTVAVAVPWRHPLVVAAAQVSAALAAGNCVVLNPSPLAPFTTLRFAELCTEAGMPPGVINVVAGGVEVAEMLAGHGGVDKLVVTVPRATARRVMSAAARRLAPVAVETGGPAGHLVFDDADLAAATGAVVAATFVAPTGVGPAPPARMLVHEAVASEMVERVVAATATLVVGHPLDPATDVGPVIDASTCRVTEALARRAAGGDGLLAGGERLGGALSGGFFVSPAVIRDSGGGAADEEVGGPVLVISAFASDDEALSLANRSNGGFRGGVYTSELRRAHRLAAGLTSGSITVNGVDSWSPGSPISRQGGRAGFLEFVRTKNVFVDLSA
jgi:aldehyde dehydrogenase (NAD+)